MGFSREPSDYDWPVLTGQVLVEAMDGHKADGEENDDEGPEEGAEAGAEAGGAETS